MATLGRALYGYESAHHRASLEHAITTIVPLVTALQNLNRADDGLEQIRELLQRSAQIYDVLRSGVDLSEEEVTRLGEMLLSSYIAMYFPMLFSASRLLGCVEGDDGVTFPSEDWNNIRLRFDRIAGLLSDPRLSIVNEYDAGGASEERLRILAARLLPRLTALLFFAGVAAEYVEETRSLALQFPVASTHTTITFTPTLRRDALSFDVTGSLAPVGLAGVVGPFLIDPLQIQVASQGTGVLDRLRLNAKLQYPSTETTPWRVGSATGTRLIIGRTSLHLQLERGNPSIELKLERCQVAVGGDSSDGFLRTILGDRQPEINFDFVLGWSQRRGVYFGLSASLEFVWTVRRTLGPISIESASLKLLAQARDGSGVIGLHAGLTLSLELGPLELGVATMGFRGELGLGGGNLGSTDLRLGYLPPRGISARIKAPGVTGGGFILFDGERQEYSGELHLALGKIAIRALGLLQTRLPSGQPGYSFLILITAEFPGIPLGFGFKLTGVGGLVGIHRQVSTDALQRGVQDGSLSGILFPSRDALRNPANVLAGIQRVFLPAQGSHVMAPMMKLSWGTPTLVEIVLGFIIRFPELLIGLLGKVSVGIPDFSRNAPVRIHVLIAGVLDPAQKLIDIRASLYDSRIVRYTIAGDMAFRMRWGDQPDFLFSLGGFHPRYRAPAGYPTLRRLSLSIGNDFGARLSVEAFLAITSNTLQFGARASVDVEVASIFSVHGEIFVYGMVTFSPFAFRLDFGVHLAVRRGGTTLFAVRVEGAIEGPGPWRIQGSASISLWLFEVSALVDLRFGAPAPLPPPLPVPDVLPQLVAAFQDAANWRPALAEQAERLVTLGQVEGDAAVFDPMGGLAVRQKVCPLNRTVRRLEQVDLVAPQTFRIRNLHLGGRPLTDTQAQAVQEWFAPGQYQPLSAAEQLSLESFVPMDAGFSLLQDEVEVGAAEPVDLGFEAIVVRCDEPTGETTTAASSGCGTRSEHHTPIISAVFAQLRRQARSARQLIGGPSAYLPETLIPLVTMAPELHAVVDADTLTPVVTAALAGATDAHAARDRLHAWLLKHPDDRARLQVVPVYLTRRAA